MNAAAENRAIASHLIRAAILAGIAFYIVHLYNTGSLTLYIAPRMSIYVKLAALGLYAVAAVLVFEALKRWNGQRQEACADCAPAPAASGPRRFFVYALFIVPLSIFFLTPDTTIGSAMASQKGMNLSTPVSLKAKSLGSGAMPAASNPAPAAATASSATAAAGAASPAASAPSADAAAGGAAAADSAAASASGTGDAGQGTAASDSLDALFPYDQFSEIYATYAKKIYNQPLITVSEKSYMEILTTLDLYPQAFAGHRATISGFVYRDPTITNDDFVVGRFAIQCCAADALPYGILVEAPDAKSYKDNSWLTITGTLSATKYGDNDVLLLKADQVESIKPAKDPYVYADLDFGM